MNIKEVFPTATFDEHITRAPRVALAPYWYELRGTGQGIYSTLPVLMHTHEALFAESKNPKRAEERLKEYSASLNGLIVRVNCDYFLATAGTLQESEQHLRIVSVPRTMHFTNAYTS